MTNLTLHSIKEMLTESGLKVTQQRLVIFQSLIKSKDHPTAELIYENIKKVNPSISLGTIYKTLEVFVDRALIKRVNTSEGNMRYDARMDSHNHIFCSNTNEIVDFKDDKLDQLISDYLREKQIKNLDIKNIRLHITGEKIDPKKDLNL